jgi:hypothetical protein
MQKALRRTLYAMVEGVETQAIDSGIIDESRWKKGIKDLYRTAETDGTFVIHSLRSGFQMSEPGYLKNDAG